MVQGFIVEMLLTSILVLTFLASSSKDNKRKNLGFANAIAVGLSVTVAHLVGVSIIVISMYSPNFGFNENL